REEGRDLGVRGDALGDAAEQLDAGVVDDGDGAAILVREGCLGELFRERLGKAAARTAERLAGLGELAADLVDGAGSVARAAGEVPPEIGQDFGLAVELLAGAAARREADPRLALVALDPEHADEANLRGAGAVGAAAGSDVEVADGNDADMVRHLGGA